VCLPFKKSMPSSANPESAPLAGKCIVVTRARHQAGQLSTELTALGADVIAIPAIEILPPESWEPLDKALRNLQQYQWLIVTSGNTVRSIRERLAALDLATTNLSHLKIAAVGSSIARALQEAGLSVAVIPKKYVAESLIESIGDQARNARVLIVRAAIARDVIPESLMRIGARVDVVDAYRNVIPESSVRRVAELFAPGQNPPDAATFTSSSTVTNFFHLLRTAEIQRPPETMRAISIGPITSQTLRDHNWEPAAEADPHDISGLIAATIAALANP
jgi:uroporphyrinogen-III synthase